MQVTDKLYHVMLMSRIRLPVLAVVDTDYIGSYKFNYRKKSGHDHDAPTDLRSVLNMSC